MIEAKIAWADTTTGIFLGMPNANTREFLQGHPADVAPLLLGWRLATQMDGVLTEVVIEEVEAYASAADAASHSHRGPTMRNKPMYGPPGTLYVYLNYGMHYLMNVIVGLEGTPHAVLLRGGTPLKGIEEMQRRRGRSDSLTSGPGRLTQALGVTLAHNDTSTLSGPVRLLPPLAEGFVPYLSTPRIGISKATELPWRFLALESGQD